MIKVKYGDTLRRFNAPVAENNRLDLNMAGLRAKICSIFDFAADAKLILTYVDEDGDSVTLVDDEDLLDVMRQKLKFLKIDVKMVNDNVGNSNFGSSGSSTPLRSPPVSNPFAGGDFGKADVFDALPEPLREALCSSLSKAASSSPVLATLADSITKIGQSILNSHPQPHVATGTGSANSVPEASATSEKTPQPPHVASASNASVHASSSGSATPLSSPVPVTRPKIALSMQSPNRQSQHDISSRLRVLADLHAKNSSVASQQASALNLQGQAQVPANLAGLLNKNSSIAGQQAGAGNALNLQAQAAASNQARANLVDLFTKNSSIARKLAGAGNAIRGGVAGVVGRPSLLDLASSSLPRHVAVVPGPAPAPVDLNTHPCFPSSSHSTNVNSAPLSPAGCGCKMCTDDSFAGKGECCGTSTSSGAPRNSSTQTTANWFGPPIQFPFSGTNTFHSGASPIGNCPVSSLPSFKRSHSHNQAMRGMFHKGVRCDGCGVYPITGSRFKSKVKENYDLCIICFNEMGNKADYIRMDRPESALAGPRRTNEHTKKIQTIPPCLNRRARPKLDSRFILDVNIIDGTMMAPSTAFTKIWRMRNNGTSVWPKGTELVWIGGDEFCDSTAVKLEAPEDGVPVGNEIDIAVDFRAPQLPGRYISHWRMASPSGHEFGQCVWVLIQVDASVMDTTSDSSQNLNLNIPLDVSSSKGPQSIDINAQPIEDDASFQQYNPSAPTEPAEPVNQMADVNQMVDEEPRQEKSVDEFAENVDAFVDPAASPPATSAVPSYLPYPNVDIDMAETVSLPGPIQQTSAADAPSSSIGIGGNNPVEEALLKELDEMGFKQVDLNKEILRNNGYNLEQAIVDLCDESGWDPILEELKEMGFGDDDKNKKLLMKNNGSIMGVVMDLISKE